MHALPSAHRHPRRRRRLPALLISAVLVAALLPTSIAGADDAPTIQPRVFGGVDADIADLPSLAYVQILPQTGCTGTVIAPEWVLTAAHCFESEDHELVTVIVGEGDLGVPVQPENVIPAAEVILHPDWDEDAGIVANVEYRGDVALVRLSTPTDQPAQPLVATGTPIPVGEDAVIAGWGDTLPAQPEPTTVLQRAEVPVVDGNLCLTSYGVNAFDPDRHVCAGSDLADTCVGDSGGPLMVERDGELWQVGVTNYGQDVPCGSHSLPAAYASVAFYRAWIEENTGIEVLPEFVPELDPDTPVEIDQTEADGEAVVMVSGLLDASGLPLEGALAELFSVTEPLPRGEMVALLLQVLEVGGVDTSGIEIPEESPFDDVEVDHPFYAEIIRAAEVGIAVGVDDGVFAPESEVSRQQGASFLWRTLQIAEVEDPEPSGEVVFDDADSIAEVHATSIESLVTLGVIDAGGDFAPGMLLTRLALVGWMQNVPQVFEDPAPLPPLPASLAQGTVSAGTAMLRLPFPEDVEDVALRVEGLVLETFELLPASAFEPEDPDPDPDDPTPDDPTPDPDDPTPDPDDPTPDDPTPDPEPLPLPAPTPASETFSDVADDNPHADGIAWVAAADITTGFEDGTFGPNLDVTRAQMATFLVRASSELEPATDPPPFPDVDPDNVHAPSIAAVAEAGITTGFQDGTFGPNQQVTRAQMATFLVRASSDLEPATDPPPFPDVDPDNVHAPSIAAVAEAGIAGGFGDGSFGPERNVTRGQMATFLARTFLWFGPTPPETDG